MTRYNYRGEVVLAWQAGLCSLDQVAGILWKDPDAQINRSLSWINHRARCRAALMDALRDGEISDVVVDPKCLAGPVRLVRFKQPDGQLLEMVPR